MKICFLTNNLDIKNGGGRLSYELINHLKKTDSNLEYEVLTTEASGYDFESPILPVNKIKLFFSLGKIRAILRKSDIVHALDVFPYGVIAAVAAIGLKKKLVVTAIGSGSIEPLYSFWRRYLLKWVYQRANRLTAISSYTAREIQKKIPNLEIDVIQPGVNYEAFTKQSDNNNQKGEEVPCILSVGRIKPRKGYLLSLRVFAEVSKHLPNLKYIIVGSGRGEYFQKLTKLINKLNLAGKVVFKENVSDEVLINLYKKAELFLLLPQEVNHDVEGFGLVFVEAAALGAPVIGAINSGAEDAIRDGVNGYLVDPQGLDKIVGCVLKILTDRDLRERFSKKSIELAKQMSYQKMVEKYLEIYNHLL